MRLKPEIRKLVEEIAPQYDQDPDLIEAMILVESAGNAKARRYEPHQDRIADGDTPGVDDGLAEDDASYGLMQIMGYTARRFGFISPDFSEFMQTGPEHKYKGERLSISMGCMHMKLDLMGTKKLEVAIARFNGGHVGNPREDGTLRNQSYVDKVKQQLSDLKKSSSSVSGPEASGPPGSFCTVVRPQEFKEAVNPVIAKQFSAGWIPDAVRAFAAGDRIGIVIAWQKKKPESRQTKFQITRNEKEYVQGKFFSNSTFKGAFYISDAPLFLGEIFMK